MRNDCLKYTGLILALLCLSSSGKVTAAKPSGHGGQSDTIRPEVVIPFMKTPPSIDGVIEEGEWPTLHISRMVSPSGSLEPRRAEFWLGTDGKKIFVAMRTAVHPLHGPVCDSQPRPGTRDAGDMLGGIFGLLHEDYFDVWVDNHPGAKEGAWYRIAVNPLGAIYDVVYSHRDNICSTGWRADLRQAHHVKNGTWTAEMAIDPASLGIKDLTKPLAFRVGRFFCLPDDYVRWEVSDYSADFPGNMVHPQSMPRVRFVPDGVVVSELGVQNEEGISLAIEATNTSHVPKPVQVKIAYGPQNKPTESEESKATLSPGQKRQFVLRRPFATREGYVAAGSVWVTDASGNVLFQRGYRWQTKPGKGWDKLQSTPPESRAKFEIEWHPTPKILRWRADCGMNAKKDDIRQMRVVVTRKDSGTEIARQVVAMPAHFETTQQMALKDLKPGLYDVKLFLDGTSPAAAPTRSQSLEHFEAFPWLNNTIGISDEVIPPFTPLVVKDRSVESVLRRHTLNDAGLWEQVRSLGKDILAGPMRLEVRQQGKVEPVRGSLHFVQQKPNRVVAESDWMAGTLRGHTVSDFDYDGCMKVTLELSQDKKVAVDSMELVIPLKSDVATLMHVCGDGLRYNYGGLIPAGEGTIWTSDKASRGCLLGNFHPVPVRRWCGARAVLVRP